MEALVTFTPNRKLCGFWKPVEENVFYVSSWQKWNLGALSLCRPLDKRFAWKTNVHSHSPQSLLNCKILLSSLLPEECGCIIFPGLPAVLLRRARGRGCGSQWQAAGYQDICHWVPGRGTASFPPHAVGAGELGAGQGFGSGRHGLGGL